MHRNQPDPAPPTGVHPWTCHGWPRDRIETTMHMIKDEIPLILLIMCIVVKNFLSLKTGGLHALSPWQGFGMDRTGWQTVGGSSGVC